MENSPTPTMQPDLTSEPIAELNTPPQAPTLRTYLGISLFWFAISFFWGAMLSIVLPDRVARLFGDSTKDYMLAWLSSAGALVSAITQVVFGALSDNTTHRLGRRQPYLIFGVIGTSIILLFFPGAQTFGALLGVYLGVQLFINIANGPYQALMPDLVDPAYFGRASAFLGISQTLGRIGGAALAGVLLGRPNGLWLLTWLFIILLNALMIANVLLLREKPHQHGHGLKETLRNMWRVPLRQYPNFAWLLISRFGIMMGVYTVTFCLLYYISDTLGQGQEAARSLVARFMILATVTGLMGTLPAGHASDRFSKKNVLFLANAICIVAGAAFALAHNLHTATLAVAVFGIGFGVFAAVDWALACALLPPGAPAKYMGIWSISDTLPQVIAPLVAGPIAATLNAQATGSGYRFLMVLAVGYFALGTLAIAFIKENREPAILPEAA